MEFICCDEKFLNMPTYLEHLRSHSDNENLYIKCNTCSQSCPNWDSFRRHNLKYHKDNNPIDLLNDYQSMLTSIISDSSKNEQENYSVDADSIIVDHQFSSEENSAEVEQNNFLNSKYLYGQYLLEMTYKYKLTKNTVDDFNRYTKKLVVTFLDNLKVINKKYQL
jgi:hypothetical protein